MAGDTLSGVVLGDAVDAMGLVPFCFGRRGAGELAPGDGEDGTGDGAGADATLDTLALRTGRGAGCAGLGGRDVVRVRPGLGASGCIRVRRRDADAELGVGDAGGDSVPSVTGEAARRASASSFLCFSPGSTSAIKHLASARSSITGGTVVGGGAAGGWWICPSLPSPARVGARARPCNGGTSWPAWLDLRARGEPPGGGPKGKLPPPRAGGGAGGTSS